MYRWFSLEAVIPGEAWSLDQKIQLAIACILGIQAILILAQAWLLRSTALSNAKAKRDELQLASIRTQPAIKSEWHPKQEHPPGAMYCLRNAGLGVAVVEHVEVFLDGVALGGYGSSDDPAAAVTWERAVEGALGAQMSRVRQVKVSQLDDFNRALFPTEPQRIVEVVVLEGADVKNCLEALRSTVRAVATFRSLAGERYTTKDQYGRATVF